MMRILGQGRVCELLADNEDSLAIDRFFRRANWSENIDAEIEKLDQKTLSLMNSYCDGINAGLGSKKMSALKLMGYKPEPWTVVDSMLISRMVSYLTLAQSQAEVERFFIELVQGGLSTECLAELFPIDVKHFDRDMIEKVSLEERIVPNELIWNIAVPRMMASNNWVVSGSKTESGAALMANDPHLEVNRLPNVWCEQSLSWGDQYLMGMGMPGLPGVVIGRSKTLAWGATYTFMDTIDNWVEECVDGKFRRGDDWQEFTQRVEIIKRKKHPDERVIFYENMHGVLEGNPYENGFYLATRWIAAESGSRSLIGSLKMANARTAEQAMDYLGDIESAWNWVISDAEGNIAYQMSGLMPKRHENWNGFVPAPGWDSDYDWKGVVDKSLLPKRFNPKEGYIVTANQDLNHWGEVSPINMPMGDYRANRIEDVLSKSDQHSIESTKQLQMDVYSRQARMFLDVLLPILSEEGINSKAKTILEDWDCCYGFDSIGAPLFETFYEALRSEIFGISSQGVGPEVMKHLSSKTGIFIDFYDNFDKAILNSDSRWHKDKSRDEAFLAAFKKIENSFTGLRWKEVNTVTFTNMLFQGKLPKFLGFDSREIPLLGGRATPHQGQVYESAGRKTSFAPSVRLIADLSEEHLYTCLAGGPSDNRFSRWYKSGLKNWILGNYKTLKN